MEILEKEIPLPRSVDFALKTLKTHGYKAYVVGGAVRDFLLGQTPHDYDVTTSATPKQTAQCFKERDIDYSGVKHGTVRIIFKGQPVEITSFRSESGYSDFRHPDKVHFITDVQEDSKRRDFTINAFYYADGKIYDYQNGFSDLETGLIRAIGDPKERFHEDALRMMRALRFSARLHFHIEEKTKEAILELRNEIQGIAKERILMELMDIADTDQFFYLLDEFFLFFEEIIPSLKNIERKKDEKSYSFDFRSSKNNLASLASLFSLKEMTDSCHDWCESIRLDSSSNEILSKLILFKDISFDSYWEKDFIRGLLLLNYPLDNEIFFSYLSDLCKLKKGNIEVVQNAKTLAEEALKEGVIRNEKQLKVNGNDLLKSGLKKGPVLKEVLHLLLLAVNEGQIKNEKEDERRWIKDFIRHRI